jgi:hypothetical protein
MELPDAALKIGAAGKCFKWSETGPVDVEITDYH